jgi:ATP-dependent Clp protease ATP-binding subunit ClpA
MIVSREGFERYRMMGIERSIDEEILEQLIRKGITKSFGARPIK